MLFSNVCTHFKGTSCFHELLHVLHSDSCDEPTVSAELFYWNLEWTESIYGGKKRGGFFTVTVTFSTSALLLAS